MIDGENNNSKVFSKVLKLKRVFKCLQLALSGDLQKVSAVNLPQQETLNAGPR